MIKGLKNKIILMIIMIGIILMSCSQVFASTGHTFSYGGVTYTMNSSFDKFNYIVIYYSPYSNSYHVVGSDEPILAISKSDNSLIGFHTYSTDYSFYLASGLVSSSIEDVCDMDAALLTDSYNDSYTDKFRYFTSESIVYSNFDIYLYDENEEDYKGDLVFQVAPQVILAPVVKPTGMETTLQEIIQLLPMIMLILVGLIGLRKALAFLLTFLRQS